MVNVNIGDVIATSIILIGFISIIAIIVITIIRVKKSKQQMQEVNEKLDFIMQKLNEKK